jgi:acyl-CoA synthetase (AMP-forming)/AMP-acid ligase II
MINEIETKFNTKVYKISGLFESGGVITIKDKILPNTEVNYNLTFKCKIVREKDGKILYPNTNGFLKIKGPSIACGVWNDIGFMKDNIDEDGWLHTGRMGNISNDNLNIL